MNTLLTAQQLDDETKKIILSHVFQKHGQTDKYLLLKDGFVFTYEEKASTI
jgi:hypothetical protein